MLEPTTVADELREFSARLLSSGLEVFGARDSAAGRKLVGTQAYLDEVVAGDQTLDFCAPGEPLSLGFFVTVDARFDRGHFSGFAVTCRMFGNLTLELPRGPLNADMIDIVYAHRAAHEKIAANIETDSLSAATAVRDCCPQNKRTFASGAGTFLGLVSRCSGALALARDLVARDSSDAWLARTADMC